jgi:8-oxo-dGTP diphosphatase
MKTYVVGFLFDPLCKEVVLILKQRPDWQVGFWNGVGGLSKWGEPSIATMQREFEEEARPGLVVDWRRVCMKQVVGSENRIDIYAGSSNMIYSCRTRTDEEVGTWKIDNLPRNIIPNLRWLIPLSAAVVQGKLQESMTMFTEITKGGF